MSSMEDTFRIAALTAVAPVAWGTTYLVTQTWLPPERPLFSAAVRALPIGLVILTARRELPRGAWWWRAGLLGVLNIGAFFALLFLAAYRLPGGLAATMTALSPLVVMGLAWPLAGERASGLGLLGGALGLFGVGLLVLRSDAAPDVVGIGAALAAVGLSALGFTLVRRWQPPTDLLTFTGWQLVAGGLFLTPLALVVEGPPPPLDGRTLLAYAYLGLVGTGLAYVAWFTGVRRLGAGPTSLIGLVNPVVGTALGVSFAGETFGPAQSLGTLLALSGVVMGQPAVLELLRRGRSADGDADLVGGLAPVAVEHPEAVHAGLPGLHVRREAACGD